MESSKRNGLIIKFIIGLFLLYLIIMFFISQGVYKGSELPGLMLWSKYCIHYPWQNIYIPSIYFGTFSGFTTSNMLFSIIFIILKGIFHSVIAAKLTVLFLFLIFLLILWLYSNYLSTKNYVLIMLFLFNGIIIYQFFQISNIMFPYIFTILFILLFEKAKEQSIFINLLLLVILISLFTMLEFAILSLFSFLIYVFIDIFERKKIEKNQLYFFVFLGVMGIFLYVTFKDSLNNIYPQKKFLENYKHIYSTAYIQQFFNPFNLFFKKYGGVSLINGHKNLSIILFFTFFYGIYKKTIPLKYSLPAIITLNISFGNKIPILGFLSFYKHISIISVIFMMVLSGILIFFIIKIFLQSKLLGKMVIIFLLFIPIYKILAILPSFYYVRNPFHFFEAGGIVFFLISIYFVIKQVKFRYFIIFFCLMIIEYIPIYKNMYNPNTEFRQIEKIGNVLKKISQKGDRFQFFSQYFYLYPEYLQYKTNLELVYGGWYSWLQDKYSFDISGFTFRAIAPKQLGIRFYIFRKGEYNLKMLLSKFKYKIVTETKNFLLVDFGKEEKFLTSRILEHSEKLKTIININSFKILYKLNSPIKVLIKYTKKSNFNKTLNKDFIKNYPEKDFIQLNIPKGMGEIVLY